MSASTTSQGLSKKIEDAETEASLPDPGVRFVKPPSDEADADQSGIDLSHTGLILPEATRGWSATAGADRPGIGGEPAGAARNDQTYFFPLPYNDEQFEIIGRLEGADGVVLVQGPPGAEDAHDRQYHLPLSGTGRRVLFTAKTPEALTALREKLPGAHPDLAIAVDTQ